MGKRAIGIIRVSQRSGREGDSFVSPADQARRIKEACERDELDLVKVSDEIDVSGGKQLAERAGLRAAVESVEAGEAEVIVVAYFDRLVRSLRVQGEVLDRIEGAGGQVLAVDVGAVSQETASKWLSGSMLGLVAEYHRRATAERTAGAQADAVARGVCPFPNLPPGLTTDEDGKLAHTEHAQHILQAFQMRAAGATVKEVRAFLADQGVERSYHGVQSLLGNRLYVGEIHFGKLVNLEADPNPIIPRDLFERVQGARVSRGRRAKSTALLARLGVLRCGSCGSRMVIGTVRAGAYPFYRCPPTGDCAQRVTISAAIVEPMVIEAVKEALADVKGEASMASQAQVAEQELADAQAALDSAIRAFSGLTDEETARERLAELKATRDAALASLDQLTAGAAKRTLSVADWDHLELGGQRELIVAVVDRVVVNPGRGPGRISIQLVGQ